MIMSNDRIDERSPRVFMLMPHDKNVRASRRFGELVVVFDKQESRPSIWDPSFLLEALDRMQDYQFDPQRDYILVVGSMVPVVMWCAAAFHRWPGTRILCFDIASGDYVARTLGDPAQFAVTEIRTNRHLPGANIAYETGISKTVPRDESSARGHY